MRRTLSLLPLALAAAFVVSGCGTERPGDEPAGAAPAAATQPAVATAEIPAGFPLDAGVVSGLDTELEGPSRKAPGAFLEELCGSTAWPGPAEQQADRLALRAVGPEYGLGRELVAYDSEDAAAAVLDTLRDDVAGCKEAGGVESATKDVTAYDEETGHDSVTFALTYREGLGGVAVQVVRVGSAVLAVSTYGEFSADSMGDFMPEFTADNRVVTAPMECRWGDGCPAAEPVTLSPDAAGPLRLGAGVADLRADAPAAAVVLAPKAQCSLVTWTSPGGTELRGAVMSDEGLVYVAGEDGVQTAEGLAVGATLDELRAAYPDVEHADNGLWYVDRGDTDYSIGVTDGLVTELGVVADTQTCVG